ncbi:MAG: cytochrome c oxidase assembly protein [Aggregatilineales bacterium]
MTEFWSTWHLDPITGSFLAFVGWRYMDGIWRLWRRAGTGRGVHRWQVVAFWLGLISIATALLSPIETFAETSLPVHMVQHLLLTLIAPPLLVAGLPPVALMGTLPMDWRKGVARWFLRRKLLKTLWHGATTPGVSWGLYALVLWGWHVPILYQTAVENSAVHLLEHISFFSAAFLFWHSVSIQNITALIVIFTTALHSSMLGVLMTFSNQTWYPAYESLENQQIAGLIMWMGGGIIFLIAGLLVLWRWLYEMEVHHANNVA